MPSPSQDRILSMSSNNYLVWRGHSPRLGDLSTGFKHITIWTVIPVTQADTQHCLSYISCQCLLTHWSLGYPVAISICNFQSCFIDIFRSPNDNTIRWMLRKLLLWWANIDTGNGLEPSGSKHLPGSRLTQFYVVIWRQWAKMGWCVVYMEDKWIHLHLVLTTHVNHKGILGNSIVVIFSITEFTAKLEVPLTCFSREYDRS